jgi:putative FmdB family regulatory protein
VARALHDERVMPTYALRCKSCGEPFELSLHVVEYEKMRQAGIECPKCHKKDVTTEITRFEVKTTRKASSF